MSWLSNIVNGIGNGLSSIPIAGDIAGGISSAISGIEAEAQHNEDLAWQANQAQLNRDFQREERIATQEYNSITNQVQQALDAGINPNSLFGTNPFVPTKASSGSLAGTPNSFASSLLVSDAQVANLLASANKANAEAEGQDIANSYGPKLNDAALNKAAAEINELGARAGLSTEQAKQVSELLPFLKGKTEAEVKTMQEQWKLFSAQISSMKKQEQVADSTISVNESVVSLNESSANKNEQESIRLAWENAFRETFGIAPNSGLIDGIIQLAVSGPKGASIVDSMIMTLFSSLAGLFTAGPRRVVEKIVPYINTNGQLPTIVNP